MSLIAWLTENIHEERNQLENEPDEYYDAVDSGESRTPRTWINSDLDSEVRHRVNLELTQQLRELRESLLQDREAGLREWGQRAGNAWDKQVGETSVFFYSSGTKDKQCFCASSTGRAAGKSHWRPWGVFGAWTCSHSDRWTISLSSIWWYDANSHKLIPDCPSVLGTGPCTFKQDTLQTREVWWLCAGLVWLF